MKSPGLRPRTASTPTRTQSSSATAASASGPPAMDDIDRAVVNGLQGGFPLCPRPFAVVSRQFGIDEEELRDRLRRLLEEGVLTRFGPMYDAERLGGAFTLCAMRVPAADFARVAALVNAHPEVAHNYEREHRFNMWFV